MTNIDSTQRLFNKTNSQSFFNLLTNSLSSELKYCLNFIKFVLDSDSNESLTCS